MLSLVPFTWQENKARVYVHWHAKDKILQQFVIEKLDINQKSRLAKLMHPSLPLEWSACTVLGIVLLKGSLLIHENREIKINKIYW